MEITIGQFAKLVGSTVRTLRYYDKIELLTPKNYNENGRKVYTRLDWEHFQQIMVLKHFGLSLTEIKKQITNETLKNRDLLLVQKQLIEKKQAELNDILEVIARMERLYSMEGTSEEDLDEFTFIMLDLFKREKNQIQAFENYFIDDMQTIKEIKLLNDPEYKKNMDKEVWRLIQAIRHSIHFNNSNNPQKIRDILKKMDTIFPANRKLFLNIINDDHFFTKHKHEFTHYFPEDIATYIFKEMKRYYEVKEVSISKDNID